MLDLDLCSRYDGIVSSCDSPASGYPSSYYGRHSLSRMVVGLIRRRQASEFASATECYYKMTRSATKTDRVS